MNQYFPRPFRSFSRNIRVKVDLPNYATKIDLKLAGVGNASYIYYWQSKGLSDERINSVQTLNHSITPNLDYYGTKTRVEFNGSCLEQDKVTFNHGKVVNIVYEMSKSINISDYPTL